MRKTSNMLTHDQMFLLEHLAFKQRFKTVRRFIAQMPNANELTPEQRSEIKDAVWAFLYTTVEQREEALQKAQA